MKDRTKKDELDALTDRLKDIYDRIEEADECENHEKRRNLLQELLDITIELRKISYPPINLPDWTETNPNHIKSGSDSFYASLADKLQSAFLSVRLDPSTPGAMYRYAAMGLAAYLEDLISDFGVWKAVKEICLAKNGKLLPFYDTAHDEYLSDDINIEDIRFIIWQAFSRTGQNDGRFFSPYSDGIYQLADVAFDILVESFDSAPPSNRIWQFIKKSFGRPDMVTLRSLGLWLSVDFPLTASPYMREHLNEEAAEILEIHRENNDFSLGMKEAVYTMEAELGWDSNCSMADVPTWEILALMARQMDCPECADLLGTIKVRPYQAYNMSPHDRISMKLTDIFGEEYILDYRPQKSDPYFSDYKSLFGNLVKFGDKWLINGISSSSYSPLKQTDKGIVPILEIPKYVMEHLRGVIRKNGGRKVYYCSSLKEVEEIVGEATPIPTLVKRDEPDNLLLLLSEERPPELYDNLCRIFADAENPFYDPAADRDGELAMEVVMSDIVQPDVMEYIAKHNLLPSAKVFASQGEETGKRLIQDNLLFLMRFYEVTHTDIDAFDAPDDEEDYDVEEEMV